MVWLLKRFNGLRGMALGVMKGHSALHLSRSAWAGNKGMKSPKGKPSRLCSAPTLNTAGTGGDTREGASLQTGRTWHLGTFLLTTSWALASFQDAVMPLGLHVPDSQALVPFQSILNSRRGGHVALQSCGHWFQRQLDTSFPRGCCRAFEIHP